MSLNISVQNEQNYYYLQLDPQLQGIYNQCVSHLCRGELNFTINESAGDGFDSAFDRIFTALDYGCPELFFIDKKTNYMVSENSVKLAFSSKYSSNRLPQMWQDISHQADAFLSTVDAHDSDKDKLHKLNEYLCRKVRTNSSYAGQYGDAHGALVNGEARCEGIAKAAQIILNKLGFKSVIAYGPANRDGVSEDHAWNIVWINNEPYGFDFTWNIDFTMYDVVAEDYMFLSKTDMDTEHTNNEDYDYPLIQFSKLTYWYQNNVEVTYRSDFSNVLLKENGNNYYAVMRMMLNPSRQEVDDEIYDWYISEMGGDTIYGSLNYRYNSGLGILAIYITVEEF